MALNGAVNASDNTTAVQLGIATKVYFPIKKLHVSPYIGAGVSYSWNESYTDYNSNEVSDVSTPLYVGISWYIGRGSIDLGFQISKSTIFTVGYTFSLSKR